MTYREIYERALWDLEHNNITLGEFEERIIPLNQEVEEKTAHWIETTLANGRKGMKCSNCGCEPIEDSLYGYVYSDYCPNCGAKMEGE